MLAEAKVRGRTDSSHRLAIYPNLAREQVLNGIDQLWVADITYVRLANLEFVYLAVVLDAFSRRVIGWALDRTLEDALTLSAWAWRRSTAAQARLTITPTEASNTLRPMTPDCSGNTASASSMSRTGNPYDNAKAESFIKTLKYEEVYRQEYRDLAEARVLIGRFLEKTYNQKRLHSALDGAPRGLSVRLSHPWQGSGHQHEF